MWVLNATEPIIHFRYIFNKFSYADIRAKQKLLGSSKPVTKIIPPPLVMWFYGNNNYILRIRIWDACLRMKTYLPLSTIIWNKREKMKSQENDIIIPSWDPLKNLFYKYPVGLLLSFFLSSLFSWLSSQWKVLFTYHFLFVFSFLIFLFSFFFLAFLLFVYFFFIFVYNIFCYIWLILHALGMLHWSIIVQLMPFAFIC